MRHIGSMTALTRLSRMGRTTLNVRVGAALSLFAALLTVAASPAQAQQAAIPTPESVLGFPVGADFKLATYDESRPAAKLFRCGPASLLPRFSEK